MKLHLKAAASIVALTVAVTGIAIRALALNYPLSSTTIRDAYFLGTRNDEQTASFLAEYVHTLSMPERGAFVQNIGVRTPFKEIVQRAAGQLNYSAPDAVEEFQNKRLGFRVSVDIAFTESYQPIPLSGQFENYQWVPDFWNDFKVKLIQDDKEIPAEQVGGGPIYSYGDDEVPTVTGARIEAI